MHSPLSFAGGAFCHALLLHVTEAATGCSAIDASCAVETLADRNRQIGCEL